MTKRHLTVKKLQGTPYVIEEGNSIGEGHFSRIVKAYNTEAVKEQLVAKVIDIGDQETNQTIRSEIQMLRQVPPHPNLVNCLKMQITSKRHFYMIMEHCNEGNLSQYLYRKNYQLSEQHIWHFLKQICEGYKVLYTARLIHRDLKPENILIHNGIFKIADFGLSKILNNQEVLQNLSIKGTPLFMAPQICNEGCGNSKVDVFSLGVILYMMSFNGKHPFFSERRIYHSIDLYFEQMQRKKLIFPKDHNRSSELVSLLMRMLEKKPEKRVSWNQLFACQKINKALRYERRTQVCPMEEFQQSLRILSTSQTTLQVIESDQKSSAGSRGNRIMNIMIEQVFDNRNRSLIQKKLYHHKLLYTFIDYTNKKIIKSIQFLDKEILKMSTIKEGKPASQKLNHLKGLLQKLVFNGICFSLSLITGLQEISGNWSLVSQPAIMKFEEIFDKDKEALIICLRSNIQRNNHFPNGETVQDLSIVPKKVYRKGEYGNRLYIFLSEFSEYCWPVKQELQIVASLLTEVYDLVLKHEDDKLVRGGEQISFEKVERGEVTQFQEYLIKIEHTRQQELHKKLRQRGLLVF